MKHIMKSALVALFLLVAGSAGAQWNTTAPAPQLGVLGGSANQPVNLILDTDLSGDVNDVGVIGQVAAWVKLGRANLLGVITTYNNLTSPPCAQNLVNYNIIATNTPFIGWYNGTPLSGSSVDFVTGSSYTPICNFEFSSPWLGIATTYAGHVQAYRQMLASAPNNSVRILVAGFMSSYADLLASSSDTISSLTGAQLVAAKVNQVIWDAPVLNGDQQVRATFHITGISANVMTVDSVSSGTILPNAFLLGIPSLPAVAAYGTGGTTGTGGTGTYAVGGTPGSVGASTISTCALWNDSGTYYPLYNQCVDVPAGQYVLSNQPASVPLIYLDAPTQFVITSGPQTIADQSVSPYKRSYVAFGSSTRAASDEIEAYIGVTGGNGYFARSAPGTMTIGTSGQTTWTPSPAANQYYVDFASGANTTALQSEFNQLLAYSTGTSPENANYAAPSADPKQLSALFWYQPSNPTAVIGSVTGLLDLSGNGFSAGIPSSMGGSNPAATAPTITASAINGLQAMTFDGTHNALTTGTDGPGGAGVAQSLSGAALPFDIYMLVKIPTIPVSNFGALLDFSTTGQSTHYGSRISIVATTTGMQCGRIGSNTVTSPNSYTNALTITAATWTIVECTFNPGLPPSAAGTYFYNAGLIGNPSGSGVFTNVTTAGRSTDLNILPLTLGRIGAIYEDDGEGNFNLGFLLADMTGFKRVLSASDRMKLLRYWNTRYNLGLVF